MLKVALNTIPNHLRKQFSKNTASTRTALEVLIRTESGILVKNLTIIICNYRIPISERFYPAADTLSYLYTPRLPLSVAEKRSSLEKEEESMYIKNKCILYMSSLSILSRLQLLCIIIWLCCLVLFILCCHFNIYNNHYIDSNYVFMYVFCRKPLVSIVC